VQIVALHEKDFGQGSPLFIGNLRVEIAKLIANTAKLVRLLSIMLRQVALDGRIL
jgi:hypothetical protein